MFRLLLPLKQSSSISVPEEKAPAKNRYTGRGEVLLIAEDDEINYTYFKELLHDYDFTIMRAVSGQEAVKLCVDNPEISMVFMDIKLPILNGYEATQKIRAIRPELPIIAQSAFPQKSETQNIEYFGFSDYVEKPFTLEKLLAIIQKFSP